MEDQKKNTHTVQENGGEIDLIQLFYDFLRIAKRIWWLFVALVVLGVGTVYALSYFQYEPTYRCEATFTVSTGDSSSFYYSSGTANQLALTFPYILDSSYFKSVLMEELGTDTLNGTLSAETITNSNMVTMYADSPSAEDARAMLDAALTVYPEVSRFVLGKIEFHLLDEVQTPTAPYNQPNLWKIVGYGGIGGLALAVLIVGLMALFQNTIRTARDMETVSSLECLAALPQVKQKARKKSSGGRFISILDQRTPHAFRESIRALDVRLRTAMEEIRAKTLLVSSSVAEEGKSTLAINLAEQLARDGKKVVLVDLDLRRQQDSGMLGCAGESMSIPEALKNGAVHNASFVRHLKQEGFYFWGGEQGVENPVEIVSDPNLYKILNALRRQVDYIILDTPPCGLFQDAAILADWADAALLVIRYDTVRKSEVQEALSMVETRRAKMLGYVLNAYPQSGSGYGYGGGYGYGRYGYGKYGYGKYGYGSYGAKEAKGKS